MWESYGVVKFQVQFQLYEGLGLLVVVVEGMGDVIWYVDVVQVFEDDVL